MKIQQPFQNQAGQWLCSTFVAASILGWTGCGSESKPITAESSKYEVADDSAKPTDNPGTEAQPSADPSNSTGIVSQPAGDPGSKPVGSGTVAQSSETPKKPSATPPADPNAKPEPEGVSQQLEKIAELQKRDPRGATREETISNLATTQREIVQNADKILKSKASETALLRAAEAKIQSLMFLGQIEKDSQPLLKSFIAELKSSPSAALVRLSRQMEFAEEMQSFANGDTSDVAKLYGSFEKVFDEQPKDAALFTLSQQVTEIFLQKGNAQQAKDAMKLVADTFSTNQDPQLVNAAKMVREQLAIMNVELESKISALLENKPKANEEFLAALDQLFANSDLGEMTRQFLGQMTHLIEARDLELADKMFNKMVAAFDKAPNKDVAAAVKEMAANFAKRKAIIGNPFVVDGLGLDGQTFDWSKYQGKVVLVDFWATWCRPCLDEIPNIKENYDRYHEQGFEVVGVNIDEEQESLQRFFARQKLPWATVVSSDATQVGFQHPLLVKCGVEAIPFLVLVGRDGKAIALNPRGEELGKKLATIFGDSGPAGGANPLRTDAKTKAPAANTK